MKPGPTQAQMESKLSTALSPTHMVLTNESGRHKGHAHQGAESHFALVLVSDRFEGLNRLQRHRLVQDVLQEELNNSVHALTQKLMTPSEWNQQTQ